jgi:peptide alpha-N-acetyltransferase
MAPACVMEPGGVVFTFPATAELPEITITSYRDESQLDAIMALISKDLSEPYSIFTFRRFVHGWPEFTLLAHASDGALVGAIVCKSEFRERSQRTRGYVAMLAVEKAYRRCGLGRRLALEALHRMSATCNELSMETEVTNTAALKLYESLGFVKDKRLTRYYLNGNECVRAAGRPPPAFISHLAYAHTAPSAPFSTHLCATARR